ncbi:heavy metal efflux pump, CzcA family [Leptospira fainei serovar Hurstbridge str. BUT 6]|uniref:Heavy metal efflux pump, CzcA family n=1 Tax=Leptospira fainei serovar Hurstbridge str. BUT 6 TaxID=1193011 RepID=S3UXI8_9LEPT|nr:CusA/CzcA family heavy metal efflux RND transporter [Leptospira fainei]EPG75096.1 heavy metal efflux pump, CzcA family [Leptospira fainei serovar Hurstbridge str. BUT 6]
MEFLTAIVRWSLHNRLAIIVFSILLFGIGVDSARRLKIDAVPDITNVQVQIITTAPALSTLEIEQYVTYPIERAVSGIPKLQEVRSVSRYGFSIVTIVFEEGADLYLSRQLVSEKLVDVSSQIPKNYGAPQIGPISTGLGEVYQFILKSKTHSLTELTTYLNWFVNPVLKTVHGVVEVNTFGGKVKQYRIVVDISKIAALGLGVKDVSDAVLVNNTSTGGGYIEKSKEHLVIGTDGLLKGREDFYRISIGKTPDGFPIYLSSVARVEEGYRLRKGGATMEGKGEVVGAIALMLVNENSLEVTDGIKKKLEEIKKTLPAGMEIEPFYDRSIMVKNTINTVLWNLGEGAFLVIIVLFLMIGDLRSGLVIAVTIPFAMLFAISIMRFRDLPANLMSMGAIDFGLIVDGAVILVENSFRRLLELAKEKGRRLTFEERRETILTATIEVRKATIFGEIIIAVVYLPILTLSGTEGKMFIPMALTVLFALLGAFFLTLTLIPVLASYFLDPKIHQEEETALFRKISRIYRPFLEKAMGNSKRVILSALGAFALAIIGFVFMGAEFIPTMDEGSILLEILRLPSSSLQQSLDTSMKIEKALLAKFPEITSIVSKTGSPELANEPMGLDKTDVFLELKPRKEWRFTKQEFEEEISKTVSESVPEVAFGISQPIQMRTNEMIAGIRSDVGIKIFGEELATLKALAEKIATISRGVEGVADLRIEQLSGLEYLRIRPKREAMARYGYNVNDVNQIAESLASGYPVGILFEGQKRFEITVVSDWKLENDLGSLRALPVGTKGKIVPFGELADVSIEDGPVQINHENQYRLALVQFNVRGSDMLSTVRRVDDRIRSKIVFPPGYRYELGGEFKKYNSARSTLLLVVPITLVVIFLFLYLAFREPSPALLIFLNVPFAITGGVFSLLLRGMPFSIPAGIGFIALFGIAILNGLVLVTFAREEEIDGSDSVTAIKKAAEHRLRPVITTALLASIGFLPMALSTSPGAEVQRPLATVVIGGLISASLLTLIVIPVVYARFIHRVKRGKG